MAVLVPLVVWREHPWPALVCEVEGESSCFWMLLKLHAHRSCSSMCQVPELKKVKDLWKISSDLTCRLQKILLVAVWQKVDICRPYVRANEDGIWWWSQLNLLGISCLCSIHRTQQARRAFSLLSSLMHVTFTMKNKLPSILVSELLGALWHLKRNLTSCK